jgi:drug/metabolite transporter (DMT)-like permease
VPSFGAEPRRALATLALFAGAIAIAFAPIFVRIAETGPLSTAFWRIALSLPVAWGWWLFERRRDHAGTGSPRRGATVLLLAGLFFAGDLGIWHLSLTMTPVANSTLLVNTAPFFVTLGAWLLWRERARPSFWVGMLLAFAGAAMLVRTSLAATPRQFAGDALALLAAVSYAGYLLAVARAREGWPTAAIMAVGATVTCAALLPIALLSNEPFWPQSARGWLVLAGLAAVAQLLGQSLITYALAHLPASFSSVGLLVQPVMAALFAWLLLGEALAPLQALGGLIVLAGIALARRAQTRG